MPRKPPVAPVNHTVRRLDVLIAAASALQSMEQWRRDEHYAHAAKYMAQAEALLELLEGDDCGSHGGFDTGRGQKPPSGNPYERIYARYNWLAQLATNEE